jgi:hypothetical protein
VRLTDYIYTGPQVVHATIKCFRLMNNVPLYVLVDCDCDMYGDEIASSTWIDVRLTHFKLGQKLGVPPLSV